MSAFQRLFALSTETFKLNLSAATNATIGLATATTTLVVNNTAGIEILALGDSIDQYLVDSATDVIVENFDGGTDTVLASVNCTLGTNFENLTL